MTLLVHDWSMALLKCLVIRSFLNCTSLNPTMVVSVASDLIMRCPFVSVYRHCPVSNNVVHHWYNRSYLRQSIVDQIHPGC